MNEVEIDLNLHVHDHEGNDMVIIVHMRGYHRALEKVIEATHLVSNIMQCSTSTLKKSTYFF